MFVLLVIRLVMSGYFHVGFKASVICFAIYLVIIHDAAVAASVAASAVMYAAALNPFSIQPK